MKGLTCWRGIWLSGGIPKAWTRAEQWRAWGVTLHLSTGKDFILKGCGLHASRGGDRRDGRAAVRNCRTAPWWRVDRNPTNSFQWSTPLLFIWCLWVLSVVWPSESGKVCKAAPPTLTRLPSAPPFWHLNTQGNKDGVEGAGHRKQRVKNGQSSAWVPQPQRPPVPLILPLNCSLVATGDFEEKKQGNSGDRVCFVSWRDGLCGGCQEADTAGFKWWASWGGK